MGKVIDNEIVAVKKERSSNFEILRIIAMIMIIFHHFAVHGGFGFGTSELSINHLWYYLISMGGKIGVDIFVLISGYFLVASKGNLFDIKKILKLWGQLFFYSVLIYCIFVLFLDEPFEFKPFIKTIFPLIYGKWWFATTYIVLYILHPFINLLLNKLDKKTYQILLITLLISWCIIPTFTTASFEGNSLTWFITLYAVAGYVRFYGLNPKLTFKHYFILFLVFSLITFASAVVFTGLGAKVSIFGERATHFFGQNKLPAFLAALSLFMAFANIKMKNYKWISVVSASTFGVYLIHDDRLLKKYLWEVLFKNASFQNSNLFIPYSIGVCLLVFAVCTIIDIIRKYTVDVLYVKAVDRWADAIVKPFKWIIDSVSKLVFGKDEKL